MPATGMMPRKPSRPLHVNCPQCKMQRGVRCVSQRGRRRAPHAQRRSLLQETIALHHVKNGR